MTSHDFDKFRYLRKYYYYVRKVKHIKLIYFNTRVKISYAKIFIGSLHHPMGKLVIISKLFYLFTKPVVQLYSLDIGDFQIGLSIREVYFSILMIG